LRKIYWLLLLWYDKKKQCFFLKLFLLSKLKSKFKYENNSHLQSFLFFYYLVVFFFFLLFINLANNNKKYKKLSICNLTDMNHLKLKKKFKLCWHLSIFTFYFLFLTNFGLFSVKWLQISIVYFFLNSLFFSCFFFS